MITELGHRYPDGTVLHVGYVEPKNTAHAYTEGENHVINKSLLIKCGEYGLKAQVFSSVEPESIISPDDEDVVRELLGTASLLANILRGGERDFPMEDIDMGSFYLVVKQHFVLPQHYISQIGMYN